MQNSHSALAEDLQVAPNTIRKYIQILEALYIVFRITPFSHNIARSLLKEPKIYFFDVGLVKGDEGIKFENLMAVSLLKYVYGKIDYEGKPYLLHYLQTKERHRVDFALACNHEITQIIEAKNTEHQIGQGLQYFHEKYHFPALQVVNHLKQERLQGKIQLVKATSFLETLTIC